MAALMLAPALAHAFPGGRMASGKSGDNPERTVKITGVAAGARSVPAYEMVEIRVDVAADYENPYDPDQIAVDAEVIAPNGKMRLIPGFYREPMRLETAAGTERVVPTGAPGVFCVRFTPTAPGRHRIVIRATNRGATARSAPIVVTATAPRSPGYVRTAARAPRYFVFDNGRPYFAVGENVCWSGNRTPIADYTGWIRGLGAAGGNWARLWLAYNEKGLEWCPPGSEKSGIGAYGGLGRYAQDNAWRLDEIVRLAEKSGVYLMFCFGTYGEFTQGGYFGEGMWNGNPYNARNGGPCASPDDFWTDARARKLYKQRLRYLIARWGYSAHLFGWEFWNEVPAGPRVDAWIMEMAAYLKRNDPWRHLVSTTYGSPAVWRCPDVDFTMQHMYGQAGNTADFTPQIVREAKAGTGFGKPYLLAEFGIDWQTGDDRWDPMGVGTSMHNGAWASVLSGAAGTSMLWYWDGYVHPLKLYKILTPVRRFVDTVDWTAGRFRPVEGTTAAFGPGVPETFRDLTIPAAVEWGRTPSADYTVGRDGNVRGGPVAMTVGSPRRANPQELYSRLTWHIDLPQPATVSLRLGQVCTAAHLVVSVDGGVRVDRQLTAGPPGKGPYRSAHLLEQYGCWVSDYDEAIPIELPAGRHAISVANTEGDWLQIRAVTLPRYRSSRYPDVNVLALAGETAGKAPLLLAWVHNRQSTWRTDYDGKRPETLRNLQVTLPVPAAGVWRVEWWDTWQGRVLRTESVRSVGGKLTLRPPDFARDLAVRAKG